MKEKLTIRNFGPIKNVELELGRFNVLIGEQATGKSTVAKVLAVCRYFSYIVDSKALYIHGKSSFMDGLIAWGLNESIEDDSYIYYECNHYSLKLESEYSFTTNYEQENPANYEIEQDYYFVPFLEAKSREFKSLLIEVENLKPKEGSLQDYEYWTLPTSFYQNDVAKILDNPFYIPTERGLQSIFSLGKNSIQNISDSLFNQFARMDQIARFFKKETQIEPLNITYKNVDGKGFIKKNNEYKFYSLYNAASGYQSTIPVVLLIKYYSEVRKKNKTFIIEEPELNLFPTAQQKLMEYLVDKIMNFDNSILFTTHSPYILTSLNNLINAYNIGQEHSEEIGKIIEKKYWLNPSDVSAYMMLPDGTCEDIIDREDNLIKAEKIDGVSAELNKDFDAMLSVEFGMSKKDEMHA